MSNLIKRILPENLKTFLRGAIPFIPERANYNCPICGNNIVKFKALDEHFLRNLDRHGYVHSIFLAETLNLFEYSCPKCGASDRERLYALYAQSKRKELENGQKMLEIAPGEHFRKMISTWHGVKYVCGDLMRKDVDYKIDITRMDQFEENSFDCIVCSHVLEHVKEDQKAVRELFRVMKPGGWGIMMVPILLEIAENIEKNEALSDEERWKFYGQDDHVRLYSKKGWIDLLTGSGFKVKQLGIDHFGKNQFTIHGIHPRSILYIVEK